MDECPQPKIQSQLSVGSETTSDGSVRTEGGTTDMAGRTICLVGSAATDADIQSAAASFPGAVVIASETAAEYATTTSVDVTSMVFVLNSFQGVAFDGLYRKRRVILGPPALKALAARNGCLPSNTRPLYNLAMAGVVVCFTGFRNKDDLSQLVLYVHHMGGSIRKDMSVKVTHLIANCTGGDKYEYAETFRLPVMHLNWVLKSWERHDDIDFSAAEESFVTAHRLKPFHGARVCFLGFPDEEEKEMVDVLNANGGEVTTVDDSACTHVVLDPHSDLWPSASSDSILPTIDSTQPLSSTATHQHCLTPQSSQRHAMRCATPIPSAGAFYERDELAASTSAVVLTPVREIERCGDSDLEQERQHFDDDDDYVAADIDDIDVTSFDIDMTLDTTCASSVTAATNERKRKFLSPDSRQRQSKRNRRDASFSESRTTTKRRISRIFKTPLEYFSSRRRTLGGATSSIGGAVDDLSSCHFNVSVVTNLNASLNEDDAVATTPNRRPKASLFARTFSSTKLLRRSSTTTAAKRCSNLNATKLSFTGSECDLTAAQRPGIKSSAQDIRDGADSDLNAMEMDDEVANGYPQSGPLLASKTPFRKPPIDVCGPLAKQNAPVVDESSTSAENVPNFRIHVVRAEWFWTSVQKETCLPEKNYLFESYTESPLSPGGRRDSHIAAAGSTTPGSASRRKRKRLHETLSSLAAVTNHHNLSLTHPSSAHISHTVHPTSHHHIVGQSPLFAQNKRRSSVSESGLLSVSGSFLDCTASPDKAGLGGGAGVLADAGISTGGTAASGSDTGAATAGAGVSGLDTPRKVTSARYQVFQELVQTESNYVNILHTIITTFKKHLEDMPEPDALLNNTELKIIFGRVPAIYETHLRMVDDLRETLMAWSEDHLIGDIVLRYANDLLQAYPPFVNSFEDMKEMLTQCDSAKPRFHAFLKACQSRPECGRQGLQDLMIRPVQRLGSISLLLNDILKHTQRVHPDHALLVKALSSIKEVLTHINEDKRKAEGQRVMFDIFNEIDNCPPELVSSHRSFVAKCDVVQLSSSDGLSSTKGSPLSLFLFSDQLEVCKRRSRVFNNVKSPAAAVNVSTISSHNGAGTLNYKASNGVCTSSVASGNKPYKHIRLLSLSTVRRVIDIRETDDCQHVFSVIVRQTDEVKEKLFSFAITDEDADKLSFLRTLCRQLATNECTADSEKFMAYLEPDQLNIDTSALHNGTLSKAFKFVNRSRIKVGRAFSFSKTPSKLKRAVSSMLSPFGSSTNLTPASQMAKMQLASCTNISDLGNAADVAPIAPLSVQPTRKHKTASLNALKRL